MRQIEAVNAILGNAAVLEQVKVATIATAYVEKGLWSIDSL